MFIGLGMPVPDIANIPGPSRPGYGAKDKRFINILNFKKNLMGLLYDYKNFNLSSNIFLDYVKEKEYYAK